MNIQQRIKAVFGGLSYWNHEHLFFCQSVHLIIQDYSLHCLNAEDRMCMGTIPLPSAGIPIKCKTPLPLSLLKSLRFQFPVVLVEASVYFPHSLHNYGAFVRLPRALQAKIPVSAMASSLRLFHFIAFLLHTLYPFSPPVTS